MKDSHQLALFVSWNVKEGGKMPTIVPAERPIRGRKRDPALSKLVCPTCNNLNTLIRNGHQTRNKKQSYRCSICGHQTVWPSTLVDD